jgi:hypothetical protein
MVLIFDGAVDLAVLLTEVNAAEVPREAIDVADHVAREVSLYEDGGVGIINKSVFRVAGDALNVTGVPKPRIDGFGELIHIKLMHGDKILSCIDLASVYHKAVGKSRGKCRNFAAFHVSYGFLRILFIRG